MAMSEQCKMDIDTLVETYKKHGRAACEKQFKSIAKRRKLVNWETVVISAKVREKAGF